MAGIESLPLPVMVRVHGPDPKGRKMRQHAFYSVDSGDTTLSASGTLFLSGTEYSAIVVTCASLVEPFLSSKSVLEDYPLVNGTELEVLIDVSAEKPTWLPARLLKLVDVCKASEALKGLLDAQGSEGVWEIGWTLSKFQDNQLSADLISQNRTKDLGIWTGNHKEIALEGLVKTTTDIAAACTRLAVFSLNDKFEIKRELRLAKPCKPGDTIRTIGSPFGVLSPLHFFNSVSVGVVSNCWPTSSYVILMADIRCLPGMEGGPVFNKQGDFAGILLRPLRQRNSGAEVQLILTASVLLSALKEASVINLLPSDVKLPLTKVVNLSPKSYADEECVQQTRLSVVLITVGDGAWASGIVLTKSGLILTNAHLVEPWRFGKPKPYNQDGQRADMRRPMIRVRVENAWHGANVVFVSQGPLDVALLQISNPPPSIRPIMVQEMEPVPGSSAFVIGHGLFGPRSELDPSVTAGVVSRVVKEQSNEPVMLQTTAAVHPGGSGGAVVDDKGYMIGLVTSNTRHNKGTVMPYLNFSIPCAALRPVFEFASSGDMSILGVLNEQNEVLSAVWALVPPIKSTNQFPWQRDGESQKGSRFAKFILDNKNDKSPFFLRSSL